MNSKEKDDNSLDSFSREKKKSLYSYNNQSKNSFHNLFFKNNVREHEQE